MGGALANPGLLKEDTLIGACLGGSGGRDEDEGQIKGGKMESFHLTRTM